MLLLLPVISGGVNGNNFCHHSLSDGSWNVAREQAFAMLPKLIVPVPVETPQQVDVPFGFHVGNGISTSKSR
jgi:hypothetical protein